MSETRDVGPLRRALEAAMAESGATMKDLTVMSVTKDPFRLDTPANHEIGKWLADTVDALGLLQLRIHLRGVHYAISQAPQPQIKPNGDRYLNDDPNWEWLDSAMKAARWLGYIPMDWLFDKKNAAPMVRIFEEPDPWAYLNVGIDVQLPRAEDITPKLGVAEFDGTQPHKLVFVGEKASLDPVLAPIADEFRADLYLPSGDISDPLVYQMAKIGAEDGRPMVVLYFADCDPSGYHMGNVISRKLAALKILHFPDLEFEVHRAALTPGQVREFGLPSTPLKATEKRGDKWRAAFGVEQTEIDSLATLRPEVLRVVARAAVAPFFDADLYRRVAEAKSAWLAESIEIINAELDGERLARIRSQAEVKLAEMRQQISEINDALRIDVDDYDLPDIVIPAARAPHGVTPEPLADSRWPFAEQCRRLIDSKAYRENGAA